MDRLDARELAAIRWLIGQVLVLTALVGCFTVDLGSAWLVAAAMVIVAGASFFPNRLERLPGRLWGVVPFFMIALIVADFLYSRGDILPPLFRMVIYLTLYRSLQVRTTREDMQLLLLALFLILLTGVLSLEITFALQVLVFAPLTMCLLFIANLSVREAGVAEEAASGPVFRDFAWGGLFRRMRERIDRRTLAAGCGIFLLTSGMAFLFFIFLPRFDLGAALPFPRLMSGRSLTGFTDHVRYGDVVSIINDDSIAMRVDVEMDDPPARPYWRMVVLDAYYDGGFMVSPQVARQHRDMNNHVFAFDDGQWPGSSEESTWTIYLEGGVSAYLPGGESFRTLRFNNRIALQFHELTWVLKTTETNANTLSLRYTGLSFGGQLPPVFEDLRLKGLDPLVQDTSDPDYLESVSYPETLLVIPSGNENLAILEDILSRLGRREGEPAQAFARRAVNFLQSGRGYSLESRIPDGEAESLLRWIESGSAGHCELYAGAFVLISRYAGYPTRLVTGYAGGDWNGYENYFMVRNRNAHAWCEIFDPAKGWLRVDPTPGFGSDPGSVGNALQLGGIFLDRTWKAYLDSLRILWFRRVIQFDSSDQEEIVSSARNFGSEGLAWLKSAFSNWRDRLSEGWQAFRSEGDSRPLLRGLLPPTALLAASILLVLLVRRRHRRLGFESRMRQRAGRLLQQLNRNPSNPPGPIVSTLETIRYGPQRSWPPDVSTFLRKAGRGQPLDFGIYQNPRADPLQ